MEDVPYDKKTGKIWYNGELVDWQDAKIHVLNHGLHYASCVFEGERVYDGEIFKLEEHTERLFYSAKRMGIKVPYTQSEINEACKKIINIQKGRTKAIKLNFDKKIHKDIQKWFDKYYSLKIENFLNQLPQIYY